jgi:hypothetical protein
VTKEEQRKTLPPSLTPSFLSLISPFPSLQKVFIGSFFAALGFLEGKTPAQVEKKLRDDLPSTVRSNWVLWVPANFFNFRMVPVPLQVAFSNFVALFWNTYVSFVSNRVR